MAPTPDFFELYDLPRAFRVDAALVRKRYYELSRKHHPDVAAGNGGPAGREALQMSAVVNEARAILTDPDRLMAYILKLHSVLEDEEQYRLPQSFLMEMMDLNEAVDDGGDAARAQWDTALRDWQAGAQPLMDRYDAGEHSDELLSALKDAYFRKKYLLRLGERL